MTEHEMRCQLLMTYADNLLKSAMGIIVNSDMEESQNVAIDLHQVKREFAKHIKPYEEILDEPKAALSQTALNVMLTDVLLHMAMNATEDIEVYESLREAKNKLAVRIMGEQV